MPVSFPRAIVPFVLIYSTHFRGKLPRRLLPSAFGLGGTAGERTPQARNDKNWWLTGGAMLVSLCAMKFLAVLPQCVRVVVVD
jgi:hypothetical protein